MKKLAIIFAVFGTLFATAQTKDTLRLSVNGNEIIILTDDVNNLDGTDYNAIIQKLTKETQRIVAENRAEIERINERERNGEITAEEAEELREEALEEMAEELEELGEEIEEWAESYEEMVEENAENVDDWEAQWNTNAERYEGKKPQTEGSKGEKSTTIIIDDDGISIDGDDDWDGEKVKEAKRKYKGQKTHGYFELYFGWNNWVDESGLATAEETPFTTELDFWPSMNWGFGFGGRTRLGDSKFLVRYGAQINLHYFRLKGNTILVKDETIDGTVFIQDQSRNYRRSSYRITYLDAPVLFEFDNSKPGRSNGFSLAAGGYAGLRIGSRNRLKFSDFNGDQTKLKEYNNFYTNGWRYGVMGQVGFGTFKITAKYDLNTLFRDDRATPDYQIASLTLGWVFP
jgi:hypothetical protein